MFLVVISPYDGRRNEVGSVCIRMTSTRGWWVGGSVGDKAKIQFKENERVGAKELSVKKKW